MIVSSPVYLEELIQGGRDSWKDGQNHEDSGERGLEEGPCSGSYRVEFSSSLPIRQALILAKSSRPSVETQWDGGLCEEKLRLA